MTDLNDRIRGLLGYINERPGGDDEADYHAAFDQSGVNKAKEVLAGLAKYGARLERLAYLSIGGSTGAEILHVLEHSPIRFGVLLEFDDIAGGIAEERGKSLAGKTLRVFRGDATQKITACRQLLERWHADGRIDGIVCSIQAVLHELPTRSPGYDINHLLGEALWKWDPCYFFCREPCSPRQWPERVKLSVAGVDGTRLRALASHIGGALGIPGEARSSGPDAILISRDLAVELLFKLFYITDFAHEIGERVTSVTPERLHAAAEAALNRGGAVTVTLQNSDSFERLYREYGVEATDPETNAKLPLPIVYVRLVGKRDSLSSKSPYATDGVPGSYDTAGAHQKIMGTDDDGPAGGGRHPSTAPVSWVVRAGWKWLGGTSVALGALFAAILLGVSPDKSLIWTAPVRPVDSVRGAPDSVRGAPVPPGTRTEPPSTRAPITSPDLTSKVEDREAGTVNSPIRTVGSLAAARQHYSNKEYTTALPIFTAAAEAGNPEAMGFLGVMYLKGFGATMSYDTALHWLRQGAAKGDARSMNALGMVYRDALGVDRNYATAMNWFFRAERLRYAEAMNHIGNLYRQGLGVEPSPNAALRWYEKGAKAGSLDAMTNAGLMYKRGLVGPPNLDKALHWFRTAEEAGSPRGMVELGSMYLHGVGVEPDCGAARTLYLKAASAGSADAMNNLGFIYHNGLCGRRDPAQAAHWFEKAAAAGSFTALGNLNGRGVAAP